MCITSHHIHNWGNTLTTGRVKCHWYNHKGTPHNVPSQHQHLGTLGTLKRWWVSFGHRSCQKVILNLHELHTSKLSVANFIPDTELAPQHIQTVFNLLADKDTPVKKLRVENRRILRFTHEVGEAILKRNRARVLAKLTDSEGDWQSFGRLKNNCTYTVKKAKSIIYLKNLSDWDKFWKVVKSLQGITSFSLQQQITLGSITVSGKRDL